MKTAFSGRPYFTTTDLKAFFKSSGEAINSSTLYWRAHQLVNTGLLEKAGRGRYRIAQGKPIYKPVIESMALIESATHLQKILPYLKVCLWQTNELAAGMVHQPAYNFGVLEVSGTATDRVIEELLTAGSTWPASFFLWSKAYKNAYTHELARAQLAANPDKLPIFIKPLPVLAPLVKTEWGYGPGIEKIWVDLFCDRDLYISYQGTELKNIVQMFLDTYQVNPLALKAYARYRGRWDELYTSFKPEIDTFLPL
ncbi:MAG: DUF6577 family protein [Bacteroidota bacterium]